jgi:hypothetical protein
VITVNDCNEPYHFFDSFQPLADRAAERNIIAIDGIALVGPVGDNIRYRHTCCFCRAPQRNSLVKLNTGAAG